MRGVVGALLLNLAVFAVPPTAAFTGVSVPAVCRKPKAGSSDASTPALKNGMDAYDAQMRALSSGSPINGGSVTAAYGGGIGAAIDTASAPLATDNFKSSQRWRKKTKQLATLGPVSSSFEMIEKLFLAGADVFRLNFSHGEHAQKKDLLDTIRKVEEKYDHPIAVLGDLQGPKLRVGTFANPDGELLQDGQAFRFDLDPTPGNQHRVQLPHPEIIEASQAGHFLLIDDGKMKLQVTGTGPGYLDCKVIVPGRIKDKKVCTHKQALYVHYAYNVLTILFVPCRKFIFLACLS